MNKYSKYNSFDLMLQAPIPSMNYYTYLLYVCLFISKTKREQTNKLALYLKYNIKPCFN